MENILCDLIGDVQEIVTNAWGGVTKMFQIHPAPSPTIAVTAGLAKLRDRPIASLASEFLAQQERRSKKLVKIEVICREFLGFTRKHYDDHYKGSSLPTGLRVGPTFIVGGFGRDDAFPVVYRIDVKENRLDSEFVGDATGIAWNGQSSAVERFIRGYDSDARHDLSTKMRESLTKHTEAVNTYFVDLLNDVLAKASIPMPAELTVSPPPPPALAIEWDTYRIPIDYSNLPLQDAINFVSFLVMVQAGRSRFAVGVPTVGGRTHVGVVTKEKGFVLLNEPELRHRHTGFADDL